MPRTTMSERMLRAIARAVGAQGGDDDDVDDLVQAWERVHADTAPRVDAMRREARERSCNCADGGEGHGARCTRCWGVRA